ncbi:MAG: hypothetical protein Q8L27_04750 [archaeon]|nr:hypothetical protein [archaeon]
MKLILFKKVEFINPFSFEDVDNLAEIKYEKEKEIYFFQMLMELLLLNILIIFIIFYHLNIGFTA